MKAPRYGDMRCTKTRQKNQLFYKTKCAFWCNKGYKLIGPEAKSCNATGHWDEGEPECVGELIVQIEEDKEIRTRFRLDE